MTEKRPAKHLRTKLRQNRFFQALHAFLVILGIRKDRDLLRRIKPAQKIAPTWSDGDDLSKTTGWADMDISYRPPAYNRQRPIKVMFLNSMGGSMSRLSRALMLHENVEANCFINAYFPRRNMTYPHETNVNGVFRHEEWREFMRWAVREYDLIQSTTLPNWPAVAESYDWLTDVMGQRHIWRSTGFVHHYLPREDVLPISVYQNDLQTDDIPSPDKYAGKTFPVRDNHFQTGEHYLFYSSPEKGVYFEGQNTKWLPSIRSSEIFSPGAIRTSDQERVKIFVPIHQRAMFKGLGTVMDILSSMQSDGAPIDIVTPQNVRTFFPEINGFQDMHGNEYGHGAYPIPPYAMPSVLRRVDLVVDQIIMGSYGNTGIEAMMCGKPVLGQKNYDEIRDCPVIDVSEDTLRDRLNDLIENRQNWAALGKAGRSWALAHHTPQKVAKIARQTYEEILQKHSKEV